MAFGYSISLTDPLASVDPQDSIVKAALNDALSAWSNYISGIGTLIVQLSIAPLGASLSPSLIILGEGGPTTETYAGSSGGELLYQSSALTELTTGTHSAASDITITLNSQILSGITSESSYNLVSVFEHELMHGFGMVGFRSSSGVLGASESKFDSLSVLSPSGSDNFVGGAAEFVYGGPVPLTTQLPAPTTTIWGPPAHRPTRRSSTTTSWTRSRDRGAAFPVWTRRSWMTSASR